MGYKRRLKAFDKRHKMTYLNYGTAYPGGKPYKRRMSKDQLYKTLLTHLTSAFYGHGPILLLSAPTQ